MKEHFSSIRKNCLQETGLPPSLASSQCVVYRFRCSWFIHWQLRRRTKKNIKSGWKCGYATPLTVTHTHVAIPSWSVNVSFCVVLFCLHTRCCWCRMWGSLLAKAKRPLLLWTGDCVQFDGEQQRLPRYCPALPSLICRWDRVWCWVGSVLRNSSDANAPKPLRATCRVGNQPIPLPSPVLSISIHSLTNFNLHPLDFILSSLT